MTNTWTKEDQEQLAALTLKKSEFEQNIRHGINMVTDRFYFCGMD